MGKYLQAKEVVKDSFWIVERNGTKIGTLRRKTDSYILYENNSRTETVLDNLDDIPLSLMENKYYSKFKSFRQKKLNLVGDFVASMTDKEALETFGQIKISVK